MIKCLTAVHRLTKHSSLCRYFTNISQESPTLARINKLIEKIEANTGANTIPASDISISKNPDKSHKSPKPPKMQADDTADIFSHAYLVVGHIDSVARHEQSDKLYIEQVDIGDGRPRTIVSGLQAHVAIEDMTGKVLVFANLKPRRLAGVVSDGMLLCASTAADDGDRRVDLCRPASDAVVGDRRVDLCRPASDAVVGDRLMIELMAGNDGGDVPGLISNSRLIQVIDKLKTDSDGMARFDGHVLVTRNGAQVKSSLTNADIS